MGGDLGMDARHIPKTILWRYQKQFHFVAPLSVFNMERLIGQALYYKSHGVIHSLSGLSAPPAGRHPGSDWFNQRRLLAPIGHRPPYAG